MKGLTTLGAVCALASTTFASPAHVPAKRSTITPVYTKGNAFFAGDKRFYVRGVDYQPGGPDGPDPLATPATCERDIPYFKELGINTVRVYSVDNAANHDVCMNALADAGIYLALDVNNIYYSLNRDDPAPSYNNVYLQNVFATIDAFSSYANTLLFFSGNEVINAPNNTNTAPYIKAVTRDMKNYIKAQSPRQIPVGYSAADVTDNRVQTAHYMNCGSDGMAKSDFFAFNDYSWCGVSGFVQSGWSVNVQTYKDYSIPLFLSEYGCNDPMPRHFDEVEALYNPEMTIDYSGGLVYEYTEEADNPNYGLVQITGGKVEKLPDFTTLQQKFAQNPPPAGDGGYSMDNPPSACPPYSSLWRVKSEALPAIPAPAEKYMTQGAGAGHGLKGPGSQNAGVSSTKWITVSEPGVTETPTSPVNNHDGNSGSSGSSGASGSPNAAGFLKPADSLFVFGVVASTLLGAMLL